MISLGSRAMPQMGHEPGPIWTISGCMGHVYSRSVSEVSFCGRSPATAGISDKYFSGSAANLSRQPGMQK